MKKMNALTVFVQFSSVDPMSAFIHLWSVERPAVATVRFPCNRTCACVCVLVSDALTNLIGSHILVSRLSSKSRTATKMMTFFFSPFFFFSECTFSLLSHPLHQSKVLCFFGNLVSTVASHNWNQCISRMAFTLIHGCALE